VAAAARGAAGGDRQPTYLRFVSDADGHLLWTRGDPASCVTRNGSTWCPAPCGARRRPAPAASAQAPHPAENRSRYSCRALPVRRDHIRPAPPHRFTTRRAAHCSARSTSPAGLMSRPRWRCRCWSPRRAWPEGPARRDTPAPGRPAAGGCTPTGSPGGWVATWRSSPPTARSFTPTGPAGYAPGSIRSPVRARSSYPTAAPPPLSGSPRRMSSWSPRTRRSPVDDMLRFEGLGRPRARLQLADSSHDLSRRHSEIVAILLANPGGLTASELAWQLYGPTAKPVTLRAEVLRLRRVLGHRLRSDPYRIIGGHRGGLPRLLGGPRRRRDPAARLRSTRCPHAASTTRSPGVLLTETHRQPGSKDPPIPSRVPIPKVQMSSGNTATRSIPPSPKPKSTGPGTEPCRPRQSAPDRGSASASSPGLLIAGPGTPRAFQRYPTRRISSAARKWLFSFTSAGYAPAKT